MRLRTLVAGITLAVFTAVLGAPAAYAAPDEDADPPGQSENQDEGDNADEKKDEDAGPPAEEVVPPPSPPKPTANLTVTPDEVKPGDDFNARADCEPEDAKVELSGPPGISFRGGKGKVDPSAAAGSYVITLTCGNATGGATATDSLKVVDARDAYLDLNPNDGYRDDKIEVEAYCPGTAEAKLNSPVLDDITLTRDGDNILRGKTRVEDDAKYGDSFGEVLCVGGERPTDAFYVLEHRKPDLDLDPAFGKRGDEIKVYVICDFTVGKLESDVLDDVEVKRDDDDPPWRYRGTTKVVSDAGDGEHTVRVKCGDDYLDEAFFVYSDGDAKGGTQVTVYPKGAPQTGGGPAGGPAGALGLAGMTGFATLPARRGARR